MADTRVRSCGGPLEELGVSNLIEIVKKPKDVKEFTVLYRRWVVVSDGVDAPPDGIAMCHVGSVVKAKRGKGHPWTRLA